MTASRIQILPSRALNSIDHMTAGANAPAATASTASAAATVVVVNGGNAGGSSTVTVTAAAAAAVAVTTTTFNNGTNTNSVPTISGIPPTMRSLNAIGASVAAAGTASSNLIITGASLGRPPIDRMFINNNRQHQHQQHQHQHQHHLNNNNNSVLLAARRCLFGVPDRTETQRMCNEQQQYDRERFRNKWSFDIATEKFLQSNENNDVTAAAAAAKMEQHDRIAAKLNVNGVDRTPLVMAIECRLHGTDTITSARSGDHHVPVISPSPSQSPSKCGRHRKGSPATAAVSPRTISLRTPNKPYVRPVITDSWRTKTRAALANVTPPQRSSFAKMSPTTDDDDANTTTTPAANEDIQPSVEKITATTAIVVNGDIQNDGHIVKDDGHHVKQTNTVLKCATPANGGK